MLRNYEQVDYNNKKMMEDIIMNCSNCGQPIQEGQNFCLACGTPVAQQVPQQVPQQVQPQAAVNGFDPSKLVSDFTNNLKTFDIKDPKVILPFAACLIWLIGLFCPIFTASATTWAGKVSSSANSFDTVRGALQLIGILVLAACVILKNKVVFSSVAGWCLLWGFIDLIKAGEGVRDLKAIGFDAGRSVGYVFILIGMIAVAASVAWPWLEDAGVIKKKA